MLTVIKSFIIGLGIGCLILLLKPFFILNNSFSSTQPDFNNYTYAIEQSAPAVVNIYVETADPTEPYSYQIQNSGSGIIVDSEGYIITNYHVIMNAKKESTIIGVILRDGSKYKGEIIGYDKRTDLAVIKIYSNNSLPTIKINPHRKTRLGDIVLAIGNPLNLGQTVTHGIISAVGRSGSGITNFNTMDLSAGIQQLIQTDAPINEGNSGGALVNTYGELVGINTATLNNEYGANGISFAIPQELAFKIMNDLIKHRRVIRGYLGITAKDVSSLNNSNNLNGLSGIIIKNINPNGPSYNILQPNDIITYINNKPVHDLKSAMEFIADSEPGEIVRFNIIRDGKLFTADIKVTEEPY
jgi:serine protease DegS